MHVSLKDLNIPKNGTVCQVSNPLDSFERELLFILAHYVLYLRSYKRQIVSTKKLRR